MRLFETKSIYNPVDKCWNELFFIDGEKVDEETYYNDIEIEQEYYSDDEDYDNKIDCCQCECCCNEKKTIGKLIDKYTLEMLETNLCPCCISKSLENFYNEVVNSILD